MTRALAIITKFISYILVKFAIIIGDGELVAFGADANKRADANKGVATNIV